MKNFTFLAICLFLAQLTFAQGYLSNSPKKELKSETVKVTPITKEVRESLDYGSAIWYEDFDGAMPATFSVLDYSAAGDQYWIWTNVGPTGAYATAPIASTTASNGWLIYDSDVYCGASDDAYFVMPEIDLSAYTNVKLSFEQFYRDYYDETTIEVSNDGTNWTVYPVNEEINTNSSTLNPSLVEINISAVAGGMDHVFIRFHFTGACGYNWQVDDIALFELAPDDLVLEKIYPGFYYSNGGPYSKVPVLQRMGVSFGADIFNLGFNTQTNVALNVTVNDGTTDVYDITGPAIASFATTETDSIGTDEAFVPEEVVADYTAVFNLISDGVDATPENNTDTLRFSITSTTYSRWFEYNATTSPSNYTGSADGDFLGYSISMFEPDVLKSLSFFLHPSSTSSTTVVPVIYENSADDIIIYEGEEYDITEQDIANGWVTIEFEDLTGTDLDVDPAGGTDYIIGLRCFWGEGTLLFGSDDSPFHAFNYTSYLKQADGWGWITRVPMFELTMAGEIPVSAEENSLLNNMNIYPNPAKDVAEISFDLASSQEVNVKVFDLTGNLVYQNFEGKLPAGKRTAKIDFSSYSSGIYSVQLMAGGNVITKKIVKN
ncbi:MAG: T9SS type A sorting domain-containing protein [Bacteroidales bacterium]|nr:T9SS type A sorting domain-containing protein [Bacteroidales bacterium]